MFIIEALLKVRYSDDNDADHAGFQWFHVHLGWPLSSFHIHEILTVNAAIKKLEVCAISGVAPEEPVFAPKTGLET